MLNFEFPLIFTCHNSFPFELYNHIKCKRASLVTQTVKNLLAIQVSLVQSLGQKDLLEKEIGTHSSILAWRIPWTEEPGRLQSMGSERIGHD